jgi:ankyrin repeat protein
MVKFFLHLTLLLGLTSTNVIAFALTASKATFAAEIFFVSGEKPKVGYTSKLDNFVCKISQINLEAVIAIGHASTDEINPQKLSELRAEKIKRNLVQMGLPFNRIYVEGKGSSQSVSKDGKDWRNRRVEVEVVGSGFKKPKDCDAGWNQALVDLPINQALLAAHAQVKEGRIEPYVPAAAAIFARRDELLEALLVGPKRIRLAAEDRTELFHNAILSNDIKYLERLIRFGIKPSEFKQKSLPVIWAVCEFNPSKNSESTRLQMVDALIAWGAKPEVAFIDLGRGQSALVCAARQNLMLIADRLISSGANLDLPKSYPPILAAANFPLMLRKLVDAGADVQAKYDYGNNLFHEFKFFTPADVSWLASKGVDINAQPGSYTPLHIALRYASPEVLDAFIANGALTNPVARPLIDEAMSNIPGLIWAIDKGLPLQSRPSIAHFVAVRGDSAIPVMEALSRRGISLSQADEKGDTPLLQAVNAYSPALVKRLVELGAIDQPWKAANARGFAERLQIRRIPMQCVDCFRAPGTYEAEMRKLNSDEVLADRQNRKNQIIEILKAVEKQP